MKSHKNGVDKDGGRTHRKNVTIVSPETKISNGNNYTIMFVMSCMNICFHTCNELKGDDIKQISYIQVLIHIYYCKYSHRIVHWRLSE